MYVYNRISNIKQHLVGKLPTNLTVQKTPTTSGTFWSKKPPFFGEAKSVVSYNTVLAVVESCTSRVHTLLGQITIIPEPELHPGRLTWNLQITHLERRMIFQTSMIMFHVNIQGCKVIFGWDSSTKPPFAVTSAEVVINCLDTFLRFFT